MRCCFISELFFENLARKFSFLEPSLKTARINVEPAVYLKNSLLSAVYFSLFIFFLLLIISYFFSVNILFSVVIALFFFLFFFYYFINKPRFSVLKAEMLVESEIVYAVRFLILELKTQSSLFDALVTTSKNFALIGVYLDEIIEKVKLGKTLEDSLLEAVEVCPSPHLRNVYWQLLNSLQTGADVTPALETLLEDIVESQKIRIEEYGRELNALSLFYMMIAIVIPTIGLTIIIAVLTFMGFPISLGFLIFIWVLLTVIQYFFLMLTSNRRPAVEGY